MSNSCTRWIPRALLLGALLGLPAPVQAHPPGNIGDFVWSDLNRNGVQDPGEPGVPGVTVRLLDCETGGTPLISTTTNADGRYYFYGASGSRIYQLEFVLPSGSSFTTPLQGGDPNLDSDADTTTGRGRCFNFPGGGDDYSWDAGLVSGPPPSAQIGDFVWLDANANGVQDSGEAGVSGVQVSLFQCGTGASMGSTSTDGNGRYLFTVPSGDYYLRFVPPTGASLIPQDIGGNDAVDSDANPATGLTACTHLDPGEQDLSWDAGITPPPPAPAAVGNFVWNDLNSNGIQDTGEAGVPGVTVRLFTCGGASPLSSTTTAADGSYAFTGLAPGSYSLLFVAPSGSTFSPQDQGGNNAVDSDPNVGTGATACFTLVAGQVDNTWDAGLISALTPTPCPDGSFSFSYDAGGNLNIIFDQFPAPNDNSYGVNSVGWSRAHRFSDLVNSDHAGFQLRDAGGTVRLSFNIDYLSADSTAPSGYSSLGPFGGDGDVLVGTLTRSDISWTTSLARNLNNVNIPGLFNARVQQFGSVNVLVDSPPTDPLHQTYNISDPLLAGWDFRNTYFVTISAAKLASIGFNRATWKVEPNLDALHNSPPKECPAGAGGDALAVTKTEVKDKQVKVTIQNNGSADVFVTGLQLTWPTANGKLVQVKLDGDVIYDNPDIAAPSANLTLAQLVADQNKRKIGKGSSDVLTLIFERNAASNLSSYTGSISTTGSSLIILP